MRAALILCLLAVVLSGIQAQTVTQLETQYTTKEPDTLNIQTYSIWYSMSTCANSGVTQTYTIDPVMPFAAWDYESGNILQVTAYDGLSVCSFAIPLLSSSLLSRPNNHFPTLTR